MKIKNYRYEKDLLESFYNILDSDKSPWGRLRTANEFNYIRGKTDIIALDDKDNIIAFEMKLNKWRDALQQAYRNTCFAHHSYVVLPEQIKNRVLRYSVEFLRRSVGLCFIKNNSIIIELSPSYQKPIQPWLSNKAMQIIQSSY